MPIELEEFRHEFLQDVLGESDAGGRYTEDAFFDLFCAELVEAAELDTADRAFYSARGLQVDGYGGDPLSANGTLSLVAVDFSQSPETQTLTAKEIDAAFRRVSNFVQKSLDLDFRNSMEETTPAFGLSDMIAARWSGISKIRMLLVSDRVLSSRIEGLPSSEIDGVPVTYDVWDMGRLYRYASSGHEREDIEVDLLETFGHGVPALPAHLPGTDYEAYLLVLPGVELASIYDIWTSRLLEQNVRVFLQARGNVNKGIRDTIENDPSMFFAYNNGITATAEGIESRETPGGLEITALRNLQIVNGGQTTASIHAASRKKGVDLSKVFVQMKLSIIAPERAIDVVPLISEYANSQNRVNAADFFANHPFHVRMEEFSRRLYAPSAEGSFRESKWFYERARGQYADSRGRLSGSQRRKFDAEFPKRQLFNKTDMAKYLMVWREKPDTVSKGAQKNFADFARIVGVEWTKQETAFNELYFKHLVAKAIVFRATEKLVTAQPWYDGGYRANVVAYAIAKLAHDVAAEGKRVDFGTIWRRQSVLEPLEESLVAAAEAVHEVIVNPASGIRNVTEWAKQQACWARAERLVVHYPRELDHCLVSEADARKEESEGTKGQRIDNGIADQARVATAGPELWRQVRDWGIEHKLVSPLEQSILNVAIHMPAMVPTEKQAKVLLLMVKRLHGEGCMIGRDLFV